MGADEFTTMLQLREQFERAAPQFSSQSNRSVEDAANSLNIPSMSDVTRHEMTAALAASEARVAVAIEKMRTEFSQSRSEMTEFRSDIKDSLGQMAIALASQSREIESKVSGLKIWVLGGALSGAVAIAAMLGRSHLSAPAAGPMPPAVPAATPLIIQVPSYPVGMGAQDRKVDDQPATASRPEDAPKDP